MSSPHERPASDADLTRAREIFDLNHGSRWMMWHDGYEKEYESIGVPSEVEHGWWREMIDSWATAAEQALAADSTEIFRLIRRATASSSGLLATAPKDLRPIVVTWTVRMSQRIIDMPQAPGRPTPLYDGDSGTWAWEAYMVADDLRPAWFPWFRYRRTFRRLAADILARATEWGVGEPNPNFHGEVAKLRRKLPRPSRRNA